MRPRGSMYMNIKVRCYVMIYIYDGVYYNGRAKMIDSLNQRAVGL